MKLILRFLKPHRKLFALTLFLLIVDVAGALLIPTLASEMLREGETGAGMQALVKRPELYIFDDSFSALDFKTDAALRKALAYETQSAAVLIIAQRVSTIRDANAILFMENGNIIEQGIHAELLQKGGAYAALYNSQFA